MIDNIAVKFSNLSVENQKSDINNYEKIKIIGKGRYGEVFKGRNKRTRELFAVKQLSCSGSSAMEDQEEGLPVTAFKLKHSNLMKIEEICFRASTIDAGNIFLIVEYCRYNLSEFLKNSNERLSLSEAKNLLKQVMDGLFFLHTQKILHGDMKTSNIYINAFGVVKLDNFGSRNIVALWYRPPELLLCKSNQGPNADMWGAGCIMAELWTRSPIMQGVTEQSQLTLISQLCGSINSESFPGFEKLEHDFQLIENQQRKVKEMMQAYVNDPYALDFIDQLFTIDPAKRMDSDTALYHDFFWAYPLMSELTEVFSKANYV